MFGNLKNVSSIDLQQLMDLMRSNIDVSACLTNCSNHGTCKLEPQATQSTCECNQNFTGVSCQSMTIPCLQSNRCMNNATCINSANFTSFTCQCPENGVYYGQYCQFKRNLCENVTCSLNGYCIQNESQNEQAECICFNGYSGKNCDIESNSIKIVKAIQWTSTLICIVALVLIWILFITVDILRFFNICTERIDIGAWRREKLYGEKRVKQKMYKSKSIKRFVYVNRVASE